MYVYATGTERQPYSCVVRGSNANLLLSLQEFCYEIDLSIKAPTEIFASRKYHYTTGTAVRTTENLEVVTPVASDTIIVKPVSGSKGGVGCVWIEKK